MWLCRTRGLAGVLLVAPGWVSVVTLEQVNEIIGTYVRPLIESDGGRVEVVAVATDQVTVRLSGVYAGCPGRDYIVDQVVAPALRKGLGRPVTVVTTV